MEEIGIGSRIKHNTFGVGVIVQIKYSSYTVTFIEEGMKEISKDFSHFEVLDKTLPPNELVSLFDIEKSFMQIIQRYSDIQENVQLGSKWTGGSMILRPGDKNLKEKVIPIDAFFHKIVMIRDRIRTLEQRVNASKMTDEEKVNIQQYITRIYGSLTSFNVLFKRTEDYFIGDKGE
ncbi:MAG: hypothetical protein HY951_07225 [Bacteroidia bacterium]|nr:hypothetical protein [Bacteroidia bacterium]